MAWPVPAQQCFRSEHPASPNVNLRLVEQQEPLFGHRGTKITFDIIAIEQLHLHVWRIEADPVTSFLLRLIQRQISLFHHLRGRPLSSSVRQGDADADADMPELPIEIDRLCNRGEQTLAEGIGILRSLKHG